MPTQVRDFSTDLGALSVIFDGMAKNSEIEEKIKSVYSNPQEYLYFSDVNIGAEEILKQIKALANGMNIIMPENGNIIFFYILPLRELTEEWLTDYFTRIERLATQFMVDNSTQHRHICCFTYEMMNLKEEETKISEAIRLLQELTIHKVGMPVFREQYLLYTSGVATLEEQETAMIQLLQLMSRESYFAQMGFDPESAKYLKVINQSAYYEGQAVLLEQKISEIERWQTEEYDPDYAHTAAKIRDMVDPLLRKMEKEQREFNDRVQLYPVNIRDYKRKFIKYHCILGEKERHPIVEKRKNEFCMNKANEIVDEFEAKEVLDFVEENLFYRDWKNLSIEKDVKKKQWSDERRTLKECVFQALGIEKKTEEIQLLAEKLYQKMETELEKCTDISKSLYAKKDEEKRRCMKMQRAAGKYDDLSDCCMNIVEETNYTIPSIFPLERGSKLITLIRGRLRGELMNHSIQIRGCDTAYAYQNIDPVEIVCLKVGNYINMTDIETSKNKLQQILY